MGLDEPSSLTTILQLQKTYIMKKIYLLFCLLFSVQAFSQTISISANGGTSGNIVIGASTFHASESIFLASEVGSGNFESAATAMTAIAFNLNQTNTTATLPVNVPNFEVYMKNIPAGVTTLATGTYDLTGYTQVFNGTYTLTNYGWNSLSLTTPFIRTAGSNLQVLIIRNNGAAIAGTVFESATGNAATDNTTLSSRRYNGTVAPAQNSTTLTATNFRPAIQLKHSVANDISVETIYPLGVNGRGVTNVVRAYIFNYGTTTRTNLQVTLNVTGANTFTTSVTIPSIAPNTGGFITFPGYTSATVGVNNITVSVPADDFVSNNSKTAQQDITTNQINYAIGTTPSAGVSAGLNNEIAGKFAVPYGNTITAVNAYFTAAGNTFDVYIYSNAAGVPGTLLGSVTSNTSVVGLNTINFTTPVAVNDSFFVSIKQLGASLAIGYQSETPLRTNAFFLKSGTNPWFDLSGNSTNIFAVMLGLTTSSPLPITLSSFSGKLEGTNAILNWNTATEFNNKGFELERSITGTDFTKIAFVAGKGNSTVSHNYQFTDFKMSTGANYYRLKQIDLDGRSSYSAIVKLTKASKNKFDVIVVNPSKKSVALQLTTTVSERATINLFSLNGQLVISKSLQLTAGSTTVSVGDNLTKGTYIISIVNAGETISKKVIVD
jgi:hypothetical protein